MSEEEKQFIKAFKNLTDSDRQSLLELLRETVQSQADASDCQAITGETD